MGVHGLWKLLESTGKPINPETLEGKILAVDISIWLNQALKGVRDRDGNTVQNAHLLTLFHRLCKLLFFRVRPVFVFDGDAPLLKKQTLAIRRQRKEEMSKESKQTHEKMLRTLLKRHAIKAALGETSQEPMPSISTLRRDEADDMYVLPALPAPVEMENSLDEEEALDWEESTQALNSWQENIYEDPSSVDINSEQFSQLPPEMKHEILKDMKEFAKRRRTMYQKPPEKAGDFSQYQLAGLLQRRRLNQRLEGVEQEMNQQASAGLELPQDSQQSVETRRLASEDSSHYILIKGSERSTKPAESQPAVSSSVPLGHYGKHKGRRPDILWTPISEESPEEDHPSSPKPSVSDCPSSLKPPMPDRASTSDFQPPSPRTLKAIEAAMMGSSSEEEGDAERRDFPGGAWGDMSPRTLLAVQNAMLEPDRKGLSMDFPQCTSKQPQCLNTEPSLEWSSLCTEKRHGSLLPHGGAVVISSSEEEKEDAGADDSHILNGNKNLHTQEQLNKNMQSQEQGEGLSLKTLCTAQRSSPVAEDHDDRVGEDKGVLAKAAQQGEVVSTNASVIRIPSDAGDTSTTSSESESSELESTTLSKSLQPCTASERHKVISTVQTTPEENPGKQSFLSNVPQGNGQGIKFEEKEKRPSEDDYKSETSDEGSTEQNFIEVSEGEEESEELDPDESELKQDVSLSVVAQPEDLIHKEEANKMEEAMINEPEEGPSQESGEDEDEKGLSSTPAANEWDHIDLTELRQLESSLEEEQHSLRGQQQQQERIAASVTGQMCQESQELLRLFGIPFLVAPMEAEAQCAALDRADLTHGTITDDSDIWLFGGRHVYKNFFSQNKYVEHYQFTDLKNQLGLDRTKLIHLAYLLGSDYTEGIPGVGYVTGMEILNEFPGTAMEPLMQFSKWWAEAQQNKKLVSNPKDTKVKRKLRGLKLHPGFPNPAVAQAYLHPAVDPSEGSFSWGRPHLDLLKEYPSSVKTEETLQPVLKQLNSQQTQLRIDSFFRLEQQDRQTIQSQRLRRAVTCMKRKERGEAPDEDEDEDELKDTKKGRTGRSEQMQEPVSRPVGAFEGGFLGSQEPGAAAYMGGPEEEPVVATECKREKKVETPKSPPKHCAREAVRVKSAPKHCAREAVRVKSAPKHCAREAVRVKSPPKHCAREAVRVDCCNSSSSDSDSESGQAVAMVTAQSVFNSKPQKRGRRGGRGRGRTAH
ncbi:hypothetical protein AALO_G00286230 [Alosa alosa]|uniref:DNA repair protein complementing XP-G cells n=1 Tax=Alosa alosa TaxID=278164 RepID=A0AAV6FFM4_9TELE|nr:hypothetical protein AALO_G00286230 [Alosa alosa]